MLLALLSLTGGVPKAASGTCSGSGSTTATVNVAMAGSGSVSGIGTATAIAMVAGSVSGLATGIGTASGTANVAAVASGTSAGTGSPVATATVAMAASSTATGSGSGSATALNVIAASGTATGTGSAKQAITGAADDVLLYPPPPKVSFQKRPRKPAVPRLPVIEVVTPDTLTISAEDTVLADDVAWVTSGPAATDRATAIETASVLRIAAPVRVEVYQLEPLVQTTQPVRIRSLVAAEAGDGTDNGDLTAWASAADSASFNESGDLVALVHASDAGSFSESASLVVLVVASDAAIGTEDADGSATVVGSDDGWGGDKGRVDEGVKPLLVTPLRSPDHAEISEVAAVSSLTKATDAFHCGDHATVMKWGQAHRVRQEALVALCAAGALDDTELLALF